MHTHMRTHAHVHRENLVSPWAIWFNTQKKTAASITASSQQPLFWGLMSCIDLGKSLSFLENSTLTYSLPSISFSWRQVVNIQLAGQLKEALAGFLFLASLVTISSLVSMNYSGLLRSLLENREQKWGFPQSSPETLKGCPTQLLHWLPVKMGTECPLAENHPCRSMNEHHSSLRSHCLGNSRPRLGMVAHGCDPRTQESLAENQDFETSPKYILCARPACDTRECLRTKSFHNWSLQINSCWLQKEMFLFSSQDLRCASKFPTYKMP